MQKDISRILKMVEDGKMTSEEANELIGVLNTNQQQSTQTGVLGKMFRIRVKSGENDKVNINIPLAIVKGLLKMGHGIAASIPEAKQYLEEIDINLILHAIENEIDGKIVDIEATNGDMVVVYIE